MVLAVAKYFDEIKLFAGSAGRDPPPKPDQAWMDFDEVRQRNKAKTAVAVNTQPAKLMPKVIMYDATTGEPVTAQDVRVATDQSKNIAAVPWKEWLGGHAAQTLPEKATHMSAIQMVLYSLHTRGGIVMNPIDVSIDLDKNRKVVKASEDLPAGSLALAPCVPKTSHVLDKSVHPHRVPIEVTEPSAVAGMKPETRKSSKGAPEPSGEGDSELKKTVYYVHPEYKMPGPSNEKLDDAVASDVRAWEFQGDETLHPFWAAERITEDERRRTQRGAFNLKLEDKESSVVTVGASGGGSMSVAFSVVVPIMTNAVDVKKGEELLLQITSTKATNRKEGSWRDDVAKAANPPQARAKAKTAATPLEVVTEI